MERLTSWLCRPILCAAALLVLSGDGSACCGEIPGPDNPTWGFSPLLAPIFKQLGLPIPNPANGGDRSARFCSTVATSSPAA
jgi:hypothetical protein